MRLNAHKNVGEIYECLDNFKLAKSHYTQALKIKENDSWVWSKIGTIEYEKYANLDIAKQCFEAAIRTRPILQKRSAAVCPVLVKLAEINFKQQDFTKCEELVDSILIRANAPNIDAFSKLFAMKMKVFFHSIKGECDQKSEMLLKLETLTGQKGCSYFDLEIIKAFNQKIEFSFLKHGSKGVPVYDKEKNDYTYLKLKNDDEAKLFDKQFQIISLVYERSDQDSLSHLFNEFLEKLANELEIIESFDLVKIDASSFKNEIQQMIQKYPNYAERLKTPDELKQLELQLDITIQDSSSIPLNSSTKNQKPNKKAPQEKEGKNQSGSTRRGLRRKMDFTEQQLSLLNLKTLDSYKDHIVKEYTESLSRKELDENKYMEMVYSTQELMRCTKLIENKSVFKNIQNQSDFLVRSEQSHHEPATRGIETEDLVGFGKLMAAVDGKMVQAALRTILQYCFQYNKKTTDFCNSVNLYRIFQVLMVTEGPFSQQWIQKQKEPWEFYSGPTRKNDILSLSGNSLEVLISIFELSLFNKFVMKAVKSGPMMEQRQILFEYLKINSVYFHQLIEEKYEDHINLQIRLIYSLMFCAFEIKNDMMHSVNLYQQLQGFIPLLKGNQINIHLPWISHDYFLDNLRMAEFGDFKIKQAKVFKDYDSGLLKLKQREHQLIEEQRKTKSKDQPVKNAENSSPEKIAQHEFDKYASFYLDQFFLYLNASVTITTKNLSENDSTDKAVVSATCSQIQNEEKVKEMWSQLAYSLCRSTPQLMFKAIQSLFCVFTAISYLNKNFYEQFILKKLDFEKIFSSIHVRLQAVYDELVDELKTKSDQYISIYQVREEAIEKIGKLFGIQNINQLEAHLIRLQITLLRQITPEFLHYNIFLTQASNNAFQNMMNNQSGLPAQTQYTGQSASSNIIASANQNTSIILGLGQQVIQSGCLINIFPQIFYYLEFFKSVVNADPMKDNSQNFKSVSRLLIHIDKLAQQNIEKKEVFVRAYTQLVIKAFPVLIKCLRIDIQREKFQQVESGQPWIQRLMDSIVPKQAQYTPVAISSSHNLLSYVSQVFKFFFDMKLNLDQLDESPSAVQQDDEEMKDDEEDEDDEDEEELYFRRQAHLSCLLTQLKREKQSKQWITQQIGSQNKSPMLKFFLNHCCLDISLFSDIISIISFLMEERPLRHGEMTFKDVKIIQNFNEVLIEYFVSKQTIIQNHITSNEGNLLIKKIKDKQFIFNQVLDSKDFIVNQDINLAENQQIKLVLDYLQNLYAHTILQQAPFQISRFDQAIRVGSTNQPTQQINPSVGTPSVSNNFYFAYTKKGGALGNFPVQIAKMHENILNLISGTDKDKSESLNSFQQFKTLSMSALRNISKMIKFDLLEYALLNSNSSIQKIYNSQNPKLIQDAQLFENVFSISYLQSLIHYQQYITFCGSVLFVNFKKPETDKKRRYLYSANSSIILSLKYHIEKKKILLMNPGLLNNQDFNIWKDKSFFDICKMILEQMLYITISRIKITKLRNNLREQSGIGQKNPDKLQQKIFNLKTVAYLLAMICDQIDIYAAPSNDPRINHKMKQNSAEILVIDIIEKLLKAVQESSQMDVEPVSKFFIQTSIAEECIQRVIQIGEENHFESRKLEQRLNLNFLYSLIQAKYSTYISEKFNVTQYHHKFIPFRRSIEIAQVNRNINGVLESFRKLIGCSLQIAIQLKYKKQSLTQQVLNEYQNIISNIVKPILQDQELKKYIFKDLGEGLLSGLRDTDLLDEQVQQLAHFNQSNQNAHSYSIEDSFILHDTNSGKVRPLIVSSLESDDDLLSGDMTSRREENDLAQIYKIADFINNNLSNPTKNWIKAKYQLMCARSLIHEFSESIVQGQSESESREKIKLIGDMLKPINQSMLIYEDQWNGMIYDDRDKKNMLTSMNHQELLGLTQLRVKYIKFFVNLCSNALEFEPIKEIYKKKLSALRLVDSWSNSSHEDQGSLVKNGTMLFELKIIFDLCKNLNIEVLSNSIENQLCKFTQVRKLIIQAKDQTDNKFKSQQLKQAKDVFEKMKKELQVTKDNVPSQLKEVFDVFVDVHSKKGFLVQKKLIPEEHKTLMIQAVLNACAMCGPDNFAYATGDKPKKNAVKFLDLAKLTDPVYQLEGLIICIQWYLEVLDKQSTKKNQDFHKKLKSVMEDIKLKMQSQGNSKAQPMIIE